MADGDKTETGMPAPNALSLSPAQEAGPNLPDRSDVPEWVPTGQEQRWQNSVKVARDMMGDNEAAVWQMSRTIFNDPVSYPD